MQKQPLIRNAEVMIKDLENTQKMCQMLMSTPHYKNLGSHGIFAIVEKSKSIGIDPIDTLNGGMYFVQGRVEMTSAMMNQLIRAAGHSITKDKKSDETICILHGKRADNGDTWVESFSIEDAKQAGIFRNQWIKYPKDMLFARALSRLARQLFPDVIKGCYVQGEIDPNAFNEKVGHNTDDQAQEVQCDLNITKEEASVLDKLISADQEYRTTVINFLKKHHNAESLVDMPRVVYEKILPIATRKFEEQSTKSPELVYGEEHQMAMEA
jgi:hypothetical protein